MSSYKPHVVCKQRPGPPWRSAVKVFADMPASRDLAVFGRAGAPEIDYELPFVVKASKSANWNTVIEACQC